MFTPREYPEEREYVLRRQKRIWDIIRDPEVTLRSQFDMKVAAVIQHYKVPSVLQTKIHKLMKNGELPTDGQAAMNLPLVIERLKGVNIEAGDVIRLPVRRNYSPIVPLQVSNTYIHPIGTGIIREANLLKFETIAFNGRVIMPFYENESFAQYVFNNIMHAFDAVSTTELIARQLWQGYYAAIIESSGFNDYVATESFYSDTVTDSNGNTYDTYMVPKYDVRSLKRIPRRSTVVNDTRQKIDTIRYRERFKPTQQRRIEPEHLMIFKVFPFKDGHYITTDGSNKIIYMDVPEVKDESTMIEINNICGSEDLESAIMGTTDTQLNLNDLRSYAVRTNELVKQGIALLILRRMLGSVIEINTIRIDLPTFDEVLQWVTPTCSITKLVLPRPLYPDIESSSSSYSLLLIKTISRACASKRDAVFLASSYYLPECDYTETFQRLETDAERYVFMTLVLQHHNSSSIQEYRRKLKPRFNVKDVNESLPSIYIYNRAIVQPNIKEELNKNTIHLVKPTDMTRNVKCPPTVCMNKYRFTDELLNELVEEGVASMNLEQESAYIALTISTVGSL